MFYISTVGIAVIFLIWDGVFTANGIWGFNPEYILGLNIFQMPIEEYLFFLIIPFCSLFLHHAIFYAFPDVQLNKKLTFILSLLIIVGSLLIAALNLGKAYTVVNFIMLAIIIAIGMLSSFKSLQQFYISFLAILVPFIIVNGLLTGMATIQPVVWYDDTANLGIRIITIPVEDIGYAFSMLFGNLLVFEKLKKV